MRWLRVVGVLCLVTISRSSSAAARCPPEHCHRVLILVVVVCIQIEQQRRCGSPKVVHEVEHERVELVQVQLGAGEQAGLGRMVPEHLRHQRARPPLLQGEDATA